MMRELCVCALVPTVETRVRIVVVAHPQELDKPTNTGRLLAKSVGAGVVPRGRLHGPIAPGSGVLFPTDDARVIDPRTDVRTLYVPDGTYRQARRILKREPLLDGLPRYRLPTAVRPTASLRRGARPDLLSTYEAVARALGIVEGEAVEAPLLRFLSIMTKRTLWLRGALPASAVPLGIPESARNGF